MDTSREDKEEVAVKKMLSLLLSAKWQCNIGHYPCRKTISLPHLSMLTEDIILHTANVS